MASRSALHPSFFPPVFKALGFTISGSKLLLQDPPVLLALVMSAFGAVLWYEKGMETTNWKWEWPNKSLFRSFPPPLMLYGRSGKKSYMLFIHACKICVINGRLQTPLLGLRLTYFFQILLNIYYVKWWQTFPIESYPTTWMCSGSIFPPGFKKYKLPIFSVRTKATQHTKS